MKNFKFFKFRHFKIILFLFLIFLIPSAFSSWVTFDLKANKLINSATLNPVCYVYTRDKQKVNYYSIEKALQKANNNETVYVIPETNPVIKYDCEIKNGVTLTIGGLTKGGSYLKDSNDNYIYADRGIVEEKNADSLENSAENRGPHETYNTLADASETLVKKYRKNSIRLEATLINNGTIYIGGRLSRESIGISDGTSGDYCKIVMTDNAVINNNGTIDCYGYIKKDKVSCTATIYNFSGSKIYQPFLITDFNGGTYSASCNIKNGDYIMPFNQWTLINIQVRSIFNYGSYMYGYYSVYNSTFKSILSITIYKGHKYGQINFIGMNNSIFNINSGNIEIDFVDSNYKYTPVSSNLVGKKMTIGINGTSEIEKMLIPCPMPDLQQYSSLTNADTSDADSSRYFFCLNHYFDINVFGKLTVKTKQKVLPGCNITISNGATMNINSDFIVVDNIDDSTAKKPYKYPTKFNQSENPNTIVDVITNNGTLNINGCSFGGKVISYVENAVLNLASATNLSVTSKEGTFGNQTVNKNPFSGSFGLNFSLDQPLQVITVSTNGPLISADSITNGNLTKNVYVSASLNGSYGWKEARDLDSYTITYHLNGGSGDIDDNKSYTYYMFKGQSMELNSVPASDPTKEYYNFAGWHLDSNLTRPISNGVMISNGVSINVYAKYSLTNYTINYNLSNDSGYDFSIDNSNNITLFTYDTFTSLGNIISLNEPIIADEFKDKVVFDGWYYNEDYAINNKVSNNQLTECKDYVLYARYIKVRPKVTFTDFDKTYLVGEDYKLTKEQISDINNEIYNIRTNANISTYINGFKINEYTNIDITTFVFEKNTNVAGIKENKYKITYSFDSANKEYKYYTRDTSGLIEGNPSLKSTKYNTDDKHFYKWKLNNTNSTIEGDSEVSYLNENKNVNDITLNAWNSYKVSIIVESCGKEPVKINAKEIGLIDKSFSSSSDNTIYYIPEGSEINVIINKTDWSTDSITKVISSELNINEKNGSGRWGQNSNVDITKNMPSNVVTIKISKD